MEIIAVQKRDWQNVPREIHEKWKAEQYKRIGYSGTDYLFTGSGPWDFMWKDGRLYCRDLGYNEELFTSVDNAGMPDVICECGNDRFFLEYGSYSIIAKCPCGKSQQVYSG